MARRQRVPGGSDRPSVRGFHGHGTGRADDRAPGRRRERPNEWRTCARVHGTNGPQPRSAPGRCAGSASAARRAARDLRRIRARVTGVVSIRHAVPIDAAVVPDAVVSGAVRAATAGYALRLCKDVDRTRGLCRRAARTLAARLERAGQLLRGRGRREALDRRRDPQERAAGDRPSTQKFAPTQAKVVSQPFLPMTLVVAHGQLRAQAVPSAMGIVAERRRGVMVRSAYGLCVLDTVHPYESSESSR